MPKTISTLITVILLLNLQTAWGFSSSTNRIIIDVIKDSPELVTVMPENYFAPVYKLKLTNYAPKGGPAAVIPGLDLTYRSSDPAKNELSAISIYEMTPDYLALDYLYLLPGSKKLSTQFQYSGEIVIEPNQSIEILFYAVSNKTAAGATPGDKFQLSITKIHAFEQSSGAEIRSNLHGKSSPYILIN